jgi:hypothetical protein
MWNAEIKTGVGYFVVSAKDEALDLLMFTLQGEITFFGQTQFELQIHKECFDVHTVYFVQFVIQTNKWTNIYIYILVIFYIL